MMAAEVVLTTVTKPGPKKCAHGKRKTHCIECGGTSICDHGRQKQQCRECGGSSICEHGKRKERCKECGGSAFCDHGKYKQICKDCGGTGICEHGKRKTQCKDCGGSAICSHGREKATCKDCGGSGICAHGKQKEICKECGGTGICDHGRQKRQCKECGGSAFCGHGKFKLYCKECGGSRFCSHGKFKQQCKECGGSSLCFSEKCENYHYKKKNEWGGFCLYCIVNLNLFPDRPTVRNYKTKEKHVTDFLLSKFPHFTCHIDKRVADGCSLRRPDFRVDFGSHVVIVEIDENKHRGYEPLCDNRRMMELFVDLGNRPIVFIRFNPDAYVDETTGIKHGSCWHTNKLGYFVVNEKKMREWENRKDVLRTTVQDCCDNVPDREVTVHFLFYE